VQNKALPGQVHAGPAVVPKYPDEVSLLGRKKVTTEEPSDAVELAAEPTSPGKTTAPKGRPTPKRDARPRRPVAPAPMTAAEARRRRRQSKLTRAERKEVRATQREAMTDRRERMMAGDEHYLLPRDKGPVRRYVRDVVDSRRNLIGLFMPAALGLIFVMLSVPSPQIQMLVSPAMLLLVLIMVIDGFVLGRKVNKLVDQKFPKNTESGWRLGFYAASRASQLRRMRAPRPQVKRGATVA
jgi:Protein of unknown function (DUF3043)